MFEIASKSFPSPCRDKLVISDRLHSSSMSVLYWLVLSYGRVARYIVYAEQGEWIVELWFFMGLVTRELVGLPHAGIDRAYCGTSGWNAKSLPPGGERYYPSVAPTATITAPPGALFAPPQGTLPCIPFGMGHTLRME